jgi:oligopeptide transport system substrate-binding protein
VARQLFRGLLWYDYELNLIPMAAKEVPTIKNGGISADGFVYTFKLRDDLKWSDGEKVTAGDFEYSMKRLLDPATASSRATTYLDIKGAQEYNTCRECSTGDLTRLRQEVGVRAADDTTLVFTLQNPRAAFPHLLASVIAAVPLRRDVIERYGDKWTEVGNIVTNGPYVMDAWLKGDRISLKPNPHWWGNESKTPAVTIRIIPNAADAYRAYLNGELDVVGIPPEMKPEVDGNPELSKQNSQLPSLLSYAYFFNTSFAPFDNPLVRRAFSLAIVRKALVENVQTGVSNVAMSWVPKGMLGHDANAGKDLSFDPKKAREMLAKAGYPDGAGLPPVSFAYPPTGLNPGYARFLQEQIQENLNVRIELQPMELAPWRELFNGKKLQITFTGWSASYPDAEYFFQDLWTCRRSERGQCTEFSGFNLSHYANPQFDSLFQQAVKEPDTNRRTKLYIEAQKILVEDAPAIFTSQGIRNVLIKPYLRGLINTPLDVLPFEYNLERVSFAGG